MSEKKPNAGTPADERNAPVDPGDVGVKVKPRVENVPSKRDPSRDRVERDNQAAKELADKVGRPATEEVREAVRKAAPGGRSAQADAAKKAAQQVGGKLPPNKIKEIQVDIPGVDPIVVPATEDAPPKPDKK